MIEVIAPGVLTSVQDTGRFGHQALGVGPGGAMDCLAARVANLVLGNAPDAPVLELTLGGVELRAMESAWLALSGADLEATLDDEPLGLCTPFWVEAGSALRLRRSRHGCRAYLAVAGGFVAERVLGSASTDLRAGFGGHAGRALRRGDRIERASGATATGMRRVGWATPLAHPAFRHDGALALIEGPALSLLAAVDRTRLFDEAFSVSPDSDRMGLRLVESLASASALAQQLSQAVAFGTVQLPPGGEAIILGADRQTTGGYPVVGVIAGIDHWRIAQARPGDALRFRAMPLAEAQRAWRQRECQLARLGCAVRRWWQESG